MRRILLNDDNLQEEDLDFEVIRVKGLIINSTGDILIAHNNGTYQFPGGHKEDDENLDDCLEREIREETGISVTSNGPFMQITTYVLIILIRIRRFVIKFIIMCCERMINLIMRRHIMMN